MNNKILIVTGGNIDELWADEYISTNKFIYIIGVDKGINYLFKRKIIPNEICGDFDSVDDKALNYYLNDESIIKHKFNIKKDDTDTQMAVKRAVEIILNSNLDDLDTIKRNGSLDELNTDIYIIGATGSRIDHLLGNVHALTIPLQYSIKTFIIDKNNKIYLGFNKTVLKKKEQYGKYISLLPISEKVIGITLTGFEYPLLNYDLTIQRSRAISNEIKKDEAIIEFVSGYLLIIESKD